MPRGGVFDELKRIGHELGSDFKNARRVLSFSEYLELFYQEPARYTRDAVAYLKDAFDYYGTAPVEYPWGKATRYKLFDLPFFRPEEARRLALVGQENVQSELYRVLANFLREGKANRLPLLHGPNGSAKSTLIRCIMCALEHYSTLEVGALYRFHWVFPSKRRLQGAIGFGDTRSDRRDDSSSYAHLSEEEIDARLYIEIRDHPLFLIPLANREKFLERVTPKVDGSPPVGEWLAKGELSHKNREVYESLLKAYHGEWQEVLRHVQVERYYISRRYRTGAVTIGPQLTVDAAERQITADRSLGSLPTSLQAVTLFEAFGELIDAAGGVLEFSDLLKRPLDAFKYLQLTIETGEVSLRSQSVHLNCVMLASANETQLHAFREHPEFESFRGRLELIRVPYLRNWVEEQAIYDAQIVPQIRAHVAPHASRLAAMFAVLTRMRRPRPERYSGRLASIVSKLTSFEKMDLFATGETPERLDDESSKLLRAALPELYRESESYAIYEGSIGASPREMRTVLLDASQSPHYHGLSPFAVLEELDQLCNERQNDYIWLQEEKLEGGYHDHEKFRVELRVCLLDLIEDEMRAVSGLVDEASYRDLFNRYVHHVSHWVKKEKVLNPVTGTSEDPDQRLMTEVEGWLNIADEPENFRHSLISSIAAWAIDYPDGALDKAPIFSGSIRRLRDAVFVERKEALARLCQSIVVLVREEGVGLDSAQREQARKMLAELGRRYGYNDSSAADAAGALARERFAEHLA